MTEQEVPLRDIVASPFQPRLKVPPMPEVGSPEQILTPLLVRPLPSGKFELIDGERRLNRLKELGVANAKCEVVKLDDRVADRMVYKVNSQRQDFGAKERGLFFIDYIQRWHLNQKQAASELDVDEGEFSRWKELAEIGTSQLREETGGAVPKALTSSKLKVIKPLQPEKRKLVLDYLQGHRMSQQDVELLVPKVRGGMSVEDAAIAIENWHEARKAELHQEVRRGRGEKTPPRRTFVTCLDCGNIYSLSHPEHIAVFEEGRS